MKWCNLLCGMMCSGNGVVGMFGVMREMKVLMIVECVPVIDGVILIVGALKQISHQATKIVVVRVIIKTKRPTIMSSYS